MTDKMNLSENGYKITGKVVHVNPNCLDSEFCVPHGETGEVFYKVGIFVATEKKIIEDFVKGKLRVCGCVTQNGNFLKNYSKPYLACTSCWGRGWLKDPIIR